MEVRYSLNAVRESNRRKRGKFDRVVDRRGRRKEKECFSTQGFSVFGAQEP